MNGSPKSEDSKITTTIRELPPQKRGLARILPGHGLQFLLLFVPAGVVSGYLEWDSTVVFLLNMLAILPLSMLLSNATEELAAEAGQVIGGE